MIYANTSSPKPNTLFLGITSHVPLLFASAFEVWHKRFLTPSAIIHSGETPVTQTQTQILVKLVVYELKTRGIAWVGEDEYELVKDKIPKHRVVTKRRIGGKVYLGIVYNDGYNHIRIAKDENRVIVAGNTYPFRTVLKEMKFFWDSMDRRWIRYDAELNTVINKILEFARENNIKVAIHVLSGPALDVVAEEHYHPKP